MVWKELVKLTLLGTERSSLSAELITELRSYGIDTDKEITEVVLESAALLGPLQKAGFQPQQWAGDVVKESSPETQTLCGQPSANHLSLILNGRYAPALTEFVAAMATHKKNLPYESLPELLDKCVKDPSLWQKLEPVIGNRGKWLIALNPNWQKLAIESSTENWTTGTLEERKTILKKLRQTNPVKGLKWLLSTWPEDGLSEKNALLKCLKIGLSDVDELFLEECLDFPRKEIRTTAATLLSQLPNSQLQKRLFAHLRRSTTTIREEGVEKLSIKMPDPKDKALIRDGISPKKKWKRGGATTGMLFQIIASVPPEKWEKQLEKRPSEILELFTNSEWALMLVEGIGIAANLHKSVDWQEAILRFYLNNYANPRWGQLNSKELFEQLPNEVFNEVVFEKLQASRYLPDEQSPLIQLLQKENPAWDDRLTRIVMNQLKEWIGNNATYSWTGFQYRNMLKRAAYNVPPKMEKQLSHFWLGDAFNLGGWEKDIQQFLNILNFRKEMVEALAK